MIYFLYSFCFLFLFLDLGSAQEEKNNPLDLFTPMMTEEIPTAGKRVRQVAPEYTGTRVYHALYLPTDWEKGKHYPVLVEYTGNKHFPSGSTGEVKDANLGYGLSGGEGFIWVSMPYIEKGKKKNSKTWWGDRQATIDYCKINLPRIWEKFGGDPDNTFICGFSRGAIACSYIGLADDEIAGFWKGMITHDHLDGQREWGYPQSDRRSALRRLSRLAGRSSLICGIENGYIRAHFALANFTFLPVPVSDIFSVFFVFIRLFLEAWLFIALVKADLNPERWVPPSIVLILFTNENILLL